jgi:flagellar basal-body rod protein FlgC
MASDIFSVFNISGQGMSVQRKRLAAVAKNIANANTTRAEDGKVYKREVVVVRGSGNTTGFGDALNQTLNQSDGEQTTIYGEQLDGRINLGNGDTVSAETVKDNSAPRLMYNPSHPDANEDGYVEMPNVNIVTEMVEMIAAQRNFEANTAVVESAKNIARDSLQI